MDTILIFAEILIFLFGIVIGSFLNVCIYRIPKGEDIVKSELPLYDLRISVEMV